MAIIKCPECGHQISDKAPVCPSCGVEIAGKVTKCTNCGEVYFKELGMCPNCHMPYAEGTNRLSSEPTTPTPQPVTPPPAPTTPPQPTTSKPRTSVPPVPPDPPTPQTAPTNQPQEPTPKKSMRGTLIISFIFAIIVCGIMYYFYDSANKNKEQEAYEYAMKSTDPMVLQSYLDTYKDADQAHIDSIQSHLSLLRQTDNDWTNAIVSGSKEALEAYLQKYPNSPHKQEAWNRIDSIDWVLAKNADTADAYQNYLDEHVDGSHIEEAENALKKVKSRDLSTEEKAMVTGLFRQFFQSINSHNADGLTATCDDVLSSLLGKVQATKADVVTFMDKLYKEDVANMNWHINNDYQIKKREVGDEEYEYQVQFSALQDVDHTDGSKKENLFKISAAVSPDGKITFFNMSKINAAN